MKRSTVLEQNTTLSLLMQPFSRTLLVSKQHVPNEEGRFGVNEMSASRISRLAVCSDRISADI